MAKALVGYLAGADLQVARLVADTPLCGAA